MDAREPHEKVRDSFFLYFIEHFLCPLLTPGRVVVIDNASPHKNPEVSGLIEKTGASLMYLPPYSPEFNPIESAWSKLKQYLRKVKARTKEALYEKTVWRPGKENRACAPPHRRIPYRNAGGFP